MIFIAASIAIMDIIDMPIAVLKARRSSIWRDMMNVSNAIDVSKPLMIASVMIASVGHGMPVNWKNAIVPRSPMEQPIKHHMVLYDARLHVCLHFQLMDRFWVRVAMFDSLFGFRIKVPVTGE